MELDGLAARHEGDNLLVRAGHLGAEVDAREWADAVAVQLARLRMNQTPFLLVTPAACLGEDERPQEGIVLIIAGVLD